MGLVTIFFLILFRPGVSYYFLEEIPSKHNCELPSSNIFAKDDLQRLYRKFTERYTGKVSYFGDYPVGITACMLDPLPPLQTYAGWIPVAVSSKEYMHSFSCGTCLKITPRATDSKRRENVNNVNDFIYATVVDKCRRCKPGELRLFKRGDGNHDIIYEGVPCKDLPEPDGMLKLKFASCKNDGRMMKVQLKNMKIPVAQMELYQNEKWSCAKRTKNNYYLVENLENITFPVKGRVTAIDGQVLGFTLEDYDLRDENEIFLPSQFYGFKKGKVDKQPILKCIDPLQNFTVVSMKTDEAEETNSNITSATGSDDIDDVDSILNKATSSNNKEISNSIKKTHDSIDNTSVVNNSNKNSRMNRTFNGLAKDQSASILTDFANVSKLLADQQLQNKMSQQNITKELNDTLETVGSEKENNNNFPTKSITPSENSTESRNKDPKEKVKKTNSNKEIGDSTSKLENLLKNENSINTKTPNTGGDSACEKILKVSKNTFLGSCDKYLACSNEKIVVRSCPKGFTYDQDIEKCDRFGKCANTFLRKASDEDDIYTRKFS